MIEECALKIPALAAGFHSAATRLVQRVHDFAVHVELELPVRGVADAHRCRVLVAA
jgi:hypothetical protein